jgi:hypothetical protein
MDDVMARFGEAQKLFLAMEGVVLADGGEISRERLIAGVIDRFARVQNDLVEKLLAMTDADLSALLEVIT